MSALLRCFSCPLGRYTLLLGPFGGERCPHTRAVRLDIPALPAFVPSMTVMQLSRLVVKLGGPVMGGCRARPGVPGTLSRLDGTLDRAYEVGLHPAPPSDSDALRVPRAGAR